MDRRKSVLNVSVSIAFKLLTMVMSILVRRILIRICGNEINGLNSLYLSIIGFLSVVELGVGSAITFCMYTPIVEGNNGQVAALYRLFRRIYWIIGGIILATGLMLTPFIHHFAKDYAELEVNLYSTFVLMLGSVVITYSYAAKTSLINAYKNNYISTAITSGGLVLQYSLQIVVLLWTKSFSAYLCCRVIAALVQWGAAEVVARRKHSDILETIPSLIGLDTKGKLIRSIKAMFMHKIGEVLVTSIDGMVIAAYIGVIALGEYSNYTIILSSMAGVLGLVFGSLTSIVGHLAAKGTNKRVFEAFECFHLINFFLGLLFYLGFYAIVDDLVRILFSPDLVSERAVVSVMSFNGFIQYMRKSLHVFRDATGTFYNDRWKPIVEGISNLVLSILLVQRMGITGVIIATIITTLLICHIVEPHVLFRNAFQCSPRKFYYKNYGFMLLYIIGMIVVEACKQNTNNPMLNILVNGALTVLISMAICFGIMILMPERIKAIKAFVCEGRGKDV